MTDANDHDRLIRVEAEVHMIKEAQAAFEVEQKGDRALLHTKVDKVIEQNAATNELLQARLNQMRGVLWLAGILATGVGLAWGWIADHVSVK